MDIINTCRVIYMVGVNPMLSESDSNNVKKKLEGLDSLIVQDIFMTETAELADAVLPAATWVERGGTPTRFTEKFNTPDGKGHFVPAQFKPPAELPDKEYRQV